MANLYFLNDPGTPIFRDAEGKIYEKIGTRNDVQPNASLAAGDKINLSATVTFSEADPQGFTQYTAEQFGIGAYLYGTTVQLPNNTVDWTTVYASAPVAGVIRWSGEYYSTIRINGTLTKYNNQFGGGPAFDNVYGWAQTANARSINVAQGDLVELRNADSNLRHTSIGLIPFVWPIV